MRAHILTVLVVDHDEIGAVEAGEILNVTRYPNDCMMPVTLDTETIEIGEWSDDHLLNQRGLTLDLFHRWRMWRTELERARVRYESLKTSWPGGTPK